MKRKIYAIVLCVFGIISSVTSIWAATPQKSAVDGYSPVAKMSNGSDRSPDGTLNTLMVEYIPDDTPFYYLDTPRPVFEVVRGTTVYAAWTPVKYASGYVVSVYKGNAKKASGTYYVKGKKTTWSKKLLPGNTYYLRIGAYHDEKHGDLQYSALSQRENGEVKTAPPRTVLTKVESKKKDSCVLAWKRPAGAEGYYVQYAASGKGYQLYRKITDGSETKCTVTGLKSGRSYSFKVTAYRTQPWEKEIEGAASHPKSIKIK